MGAPPTTVCRRCGAPAPNPRGFRAVGGDRRRCPPCLRRSDAQALGVLATLLMALLGLFVVIGLLSGFVGPEWAIVFLPVLVVLHELGHAAAARVLGFRVLRLVIGCGPHVTWTLAGTEVELHCLPIAGVTLTATERRDRYRMRWFLVVAAGPLTTVAVLFAAWWWPVAPGSPAASARVALLGAGAFVLFLALLPLRPHVQRGVTASDGWWLLAALRLTDAEVDDALRMQRLMLAEHRWARGDRDAIDVVRAECLDSDDGIAASQLVNMLGEEHRWDEAAQVARVAAAGLPSDDPVRVTLRLQLACVDVAAGDPASLTEADAVSEELLAAEPWDPTRQLVRGVALVALGHHDEGVEPLERALVNVVRADQRAWCIASLALAAAGRGDLTAARRHLAAADRADPTCPLLPRARDAVADAALGLTTT